MIELFDDKSNCNGCSACMNICPQNAISMQEDDLGFVYPVIVEEKCIECNLCIHVCPIRNHTPGAKTLKAYAAVLKNDTHLKSSASGGAFYALARVSIEDGAIVYGCSFDGDMNPRHIAIDTVNALPLLQGSKYIQSDVNEVFGEIKKRVLQGKKVLFSGTPCQVAGLKSYIGKDYDNLITIELICHGVPSAAFWKSYVRLLESQLNAKLKSFVFRKKDKKNLFCAYCAYCDKNGKTKTIYIPSSISYYYNNFLKGNIYRPSCYVCPYASEERQADITIGDFWGYSEIGKFDRAKGISSVLIQTDKGAELIKNARVYLEMEESSFSEIAMNNEQLRKPVSIQKYDESILVTWNRYGAAFMDRNHKKLHWKAVLLNRIGIVR